MSNVIQTIKSTLATKDILSSEVDSLRYIIKNLETELVKNPERETSLTLAGSNYIRIPCKLAVEFATTILADKIKELDNINLKIQAIGTLLGSNNELP